MSFRQVVAEDIRVNSPTHVYQLFAANESSRLDVAASLARLRKLSHDRLPDVAALPRGSRMPFRSNPRFVGRTPLIMSIARSLRDAPTQPVVLSGTGGIGKTQLAVECAHRLGPYFDGGVFWLNLSDPDAIPAEVASCGAPGFLDLRPDFGALPRGEQVALVNQAWSTGVPCLLIFDGCEDPTLLGRWHPKTGAARVVVTTRWSPWPLPCC